MLTDAFDQSESAGRTEEKIDVYKQKHWPLLKRGAAIIRPPRWSKHPLRIITPHLPKWTF